MAWYLRKLLGHPSPESPRVTGALADLARLAQERPSLAGHAFLLRDLLAGLDDHHLAVPPVPITRHAREKLAAGVPLLLGECLLLDTKLLRRRWFAVCAAWKHNRDGPQGDQLANAVRRGSLNLEEMVRDVLAGRPQAIYAQAEALGLDPGLAGTLLRFTLFPVFSRLHNALAPLQAGIAWQRGLCPTCGSWPLLGEYRGLDQTRFLRCGLCAAGWEFPRLRCPYCDTRDHRLLGYFSVKGEESRYRVSTCDACRGYVKMVSTLGPLQAPQLWLMDLTTMHLDLAAAERGYSVPG